MNSLLIFAKYPEPGKVKTRLGKRIGNHAAATSYKIMVEDVVRKTKPVNSEFRRILYYDPPERRTDFEKWLPDFTFCSQTGHDLGERMRSAFSEHQGDQNKLVLIGTDCVEIDCDLIITAFKKLDSADLVLGPAHDGGYYLIGCHQVYSEIFEDIEWSTERVLEQTLEKVGELGIRVELLGKLGDVDC